MDLSATWKTSDAKSIGARDASLLFIFIYFFFQAILVTFVSNGAGLDDAEQLTYIGNFEWGYGGSQPPLYTWILSAAASMLGINFFTLQLVKFSLLASMFASVYGGARLLGLPAVVASTGMLGMFLLPQIAWESQRALSHSIAGIAACSWAFLALAWHMRSRSWGSAAVFGFFLALAPLGKFNAGLFVGGLLIAALSIPTYRAVLFTRKSVLTLAVFTATLTPCVLWMMNNTANVMSRANKFAIDAGGNPFISRLMGIGNAAQNTILFVLVAVAAFGVVWWLSRRDRVAPMKAPTDGEMLARRVVFCALLLVITSVVASGTTVVQDRWLQPVLFLTPLALASWLARYRSQMTPLRHVAIAGSVVALLVIPVLAINLTYGSLRKPAIGQLDYAKLYSDTTALGHYSSAVSDKPQLVGNLRLFNPALQAVHAEMPNSVSRITRPSLVLWTGDELPESLATMLQSAQISLSPQDIRQSVISYRYQPEVTLAVHYAIVR